MTEALSAQDPSELFDIVRADGLPLGMRLPRAQVHAEGHWHRAVHIWVYGVDAGEVFVLFQRRGLLKDTWPGRLDATVGGHYRAGEDLPQALREAEEEIGVAVSLAELRPVGVRVHANEGEPGILDRELQDVFLWWNDRPLSTYAPNPVELASLVQLPVEGLLDLLASRTDGVLGRVQVAGQTGIGVETITRDDFIPAIDRYYYRLAISVAGAMAGDTDISI